VFLTTKLYCPLDPEKRRSTTWPTESSSSTRTPWSALPVAWLVIAPLRVSTGGLAASAWAWAWANVEAEVLNTIRPSRLSKPSFRAGLGEVVGDRRRNRRLCFISNKSIARGGKATRRRFKNPAIGKYATDK